MGMKLHNEIVCQADDQIHLEFAGLLLVLLWLANNGAGLAVVLLCRRCHLSEAPKNHSSWVHLHTQFMFAGEGVGEERMSGSIETSKGCFLLRIFLSVCMYPIDL